MKKYIILTGDNKNGIACFDEKRKRLTVNLDENEKLYDDEYFAIYADNTFVGRMNGIKGSFKAEKLDGGVEVMRERKGGERLNKEYGFETDKNDEEKEKETEKNIKSVIKEDFKWQRISGYYCIKNLEIVKYVMRGESVYSAINKKGYYLFGENKNNFAVAIPTIDGNSPLAENINEFAEKMNIMGSYYYVVMMGTDENGEYFLKSGRDENVQNT